MLQVELRSRRERFGKQENKDDMRLQHLHEFCSQK